MYISEEVVYEILYYNWELEMQGSQKRIQPSKISYLVFGSYAVSKSEAMDLCLIEKQVTQVMD